MNKPNQKESNQTTKNYNPKSNGFGQIPAALLSGGGVGGLGVDEWELGNVEGVFFGLVYGDFGEVIQCFHIILYFVFLAHLSKFDWRL